jgi:hypothetical protein
MKKKQRKCSNLTTINANVQRTSEWDNDQLEARETQANEKMIIALLMHKKQGGVGMKE